MSSQVSVISDYRQKSVEKLVKDLVSWLYTHEVIDARLHKKLTAKQFLGSVATLLINNNNGSYSVKGKLHFTLLRLREFKKSEFDLVLAVPKLKTKRRLKCFVGHRDTPEMRRSFQVNLSTITSYFNILLRFQDVNYAGRIIFDRILKEIKASDLCIFDNRLTENKPNVYLEIMAAIIFKKPMILFEYLSDKDEDMTGFPSDLVGRSSIRYKNYKSLFQELAYQLPFILKEESLAKIYS